MPAVTHVVMHHLYPMQESHVDPTRVSCIPFAVLVNIKELRVTISGNLFYLAARYSISLSSNAILSYVQEVFFLLYLLYFHAMYRSILTSVKTI